MNPIFQVSVVIPVYNAASFIEKAVQSALDQPETAEVLLVEDGSTDSSLQVCEKLACKNEKIKLIRHPNGSNKGAGLSRNLGIQRSSFPFVAFLDADDYYGRGRFKSDAAILSIDNSVEGVYNALGYCYYLPDGTSKEDESRLTTLSGPTTPNDLLFVLIGLHPTIKGHIHLDTLTLRKSVFKKINGFPALSLHQDSVFIIQLASCCTLVAGSIQKAVGFRGVHKNNRISANNARKSKSMVLAYEHLYNWASTQPSIPLRYFYRTKLGVEQMICSKSKLKGLWLLSCLWFAGNSFIKYDCLFNDAIPATFGKKYGSMIIGIKKKYCIWFSREDFSAEEMFKKFPPKKWLI